MKSFLHNENDCLWGFSLTYQGDLKDIISDVKPSTVKKIIDYAFEVDYELHFLPKISTPCIIIKTSKNIWHYVQSKKDAEKLLEQAKKSDHYSCCQFM